MTGRTGGWIGAVEAARLLDVSRATLYAYVSRGFVRSQAAPAPSRQRLYAREDVERLRRRAEERRAPDKAAARALQWGMPILESSLACIDGRRLYYRGLDAAQLARSRSLEDVASLIWTGALTAAGPLPAIEPLPVRLPALPFVPRAQSLLALAAARDPVAMDLRAESVARTGARVLRLLVHAAGGPIRGAAPVHQALAQRWRAGVKGADVLRAALVSCADHELNVSSFTARTVASAGSHPYAVVIAGLSALEGPKHGGAGARVEAMLASMRGVRRPREEFTARLRRGDAIDGFGHPLYRDGDPRAQLLLDMLRERFPSSRQRAFVMACADAGAEATDERPNVDFALAAVARVLKLPAGSPIVLFAIGRSVGWIGHAIEQYAANQLIRPRARYVGVPPTTEAPRPG